MMQAIAGTNAQQSAAAAHLAERMAHIAEQFAESHQHIGEGFIAVFTRHDTVVSDDPRRGDARGEGRIDLQ